MEQTGKYGLSQWDAEDRILREDFNADNTKIETALANAGNCKIAMGSYVGTGTFGANNPNTLTFDFQPLMVLVDVSTAATYNSIPLHYIFLRPSEKGFSKGSGDLLEVTWNLHGISWYSVNTTNGVKHQFNNANQTYHYIAIGV